MLDRILGLKKNNSLKYLTVLFFSLNLFIFFVSARPVTDDYSLLAGISSQGLIDYLVEVWRLHGGNLSPMVLNFFAISSAIKSFNFISFSFFSLITALSVYATTSLYLRRVRFGGFSLNSNLIFFMSMGTVFGFEGLFSPGLIGAYHFSSASAVHLWPIIATLVAYILLTSNTSYFIPLFLTGLISGNSNIAESAAILFTLLTVLFFPKKLSFNLSRAKLLVFSSGVILGSITIILSPGFWIRATENTSLGIPGSPSEFLMRFGRSALVFTSDIFTHPVFYIFAITGFIFAKLQNDYSVKPNKWNFVELLFYFLFISLIIGATFAYPAWHQSLGLLFLLPTFSFFGGIRLANFFTFKNFASLRKVQLVLLVFLVSSVLRADLLVWKSGSNWHLSNHANICALRGNDSADVTNPEIVYPPFQFGLEDAQSWPWIRASYIRWIANVPSAGRLACRGLN